MSTVPIEEIERDLSRYLAQVEAGEKLVLTGAGQPIAEITPVGSAVDRNPAVKQAPRETTLRPIGLAEGLFVEAPDFDAPLPAELLRLAGLPPLHRDPFDRLLICQAIQHGLVIATAEPMLAGYPVPLPHTP